MKNRYFGQSIWQWIALWITILVSFVAMYVAFKLGRMLVKREHSSRLVRYGLTMIFPIAAMLVPIVANRFLADAVVLTGRTMIIVQVCAHITVLVAAIFVILGAANRLAEVIISSPRIHPRGIDAQLIRLLCRVLGLVLATVIFLEGGKEMGIPITTLLAGAGVGGLAVALAAQDSLRNIFGSMMIILDKPFKVGERIIAKGYDGVVEEIGLRSTKIRLLTGHQVSIPNDELARNDVENVGRRPHIRKIENIPLALDISSDKAARAIEIVSELLKDHEGMEPQYPPRVFLSDVCRDCINLRIIYWFHPPKYWDFADFCGRVIRRILVAFEAEGIRIARPAVTSYMALDGEQPLEIKNR
jgi:MscS family membrane protein